MPKRFNITGTCRPSEHYMVDISERLATIQQMVARGDYFCINRGRQYGKTTTLQALKATLADAGFALLSVSFEGIEAAFESEEKLAAAFIELVARSLRWTNVANLDTEVREMILSFYKEHPSSCSFFSLSDFISETNHANSHPIVLCIDEVDQASNYTSFLTFLGLLRKMFLERDSIPTFQSVILASVYDIKNLKLKIRNAAEHQTNSPWNIASPFNVDMSLPEKGIKEMLDEYEADHHSGMNTAEVAKWIRDYTSGQPFLVSRLCMLMDEAQDWSYEGFLQAEKTVRSESNTLFDDLDKKLEQFPELRDMLYRILFEGATIPFNLSERYIHLAAMFGIIKSNGSNIAVTNRIFETFLYEKFVSAEIRSGYKVYTAASLQKQEFVKNGELDMPLILSRFAENFNDIYGASDDKFIEDEGRKYFMLYTKPIINGVGHFYVESQTRDLSRTDLIIDYLGHQYVVEMKIWRGKSYNERGEKQLADYLDSYHTQTGYLLSFCFNKNKQTGLLPPKQIGGKTLIEVIV